MNVVVIGGGGVGSLLAWALSTAGASVTLVSRRQGPGRSDGEIRVIRPDASSARAIVQLAASPVQVEHEPELVVLAVKAYDVDDALRSLPAWPGVVLFTVQNGIGSEELALERRPTTPVIAASLTASVELTADGAVRWLRRGGIALASVGAGDRPQTAGSPAGVSPAAVADLFRASGLAARIYPDWRAMKWSKLVANLVANATSALVDLPPAAIYTDQRLFSIERAQLREAFAVMRALGLRPLGLPGADVRWLSLAIRLPDWVARFVLARVVGSARGGKDPSLRLAMGGPASRSEVTWLNGAVARAGERAGVPAPVNGALADLVEHALADPAIRDRVRHRPGAFAAEISARARAFTEGGRARSVTAGPR